MKKKRLFFLIIIMVIAIPTLAFSLLGIGSDAASKKGYAMEAYVYPSTDTTEWEKASVKEKIAMCRIPQETLEKMTEEQLVQAVFDFPFLCNVFLYSTMESGVQNIERNSDAYAELLKREGAKDALLQKLYSAQADVKDAWKNDALAVLTLYQEDIVADMSAEEIESVAAVSSMIDAGYMEEVIGRK